MYMSWKNSLNPFGKIGENFDMTYMYWYSIKTPLKPSWEKYKEKMIWNIIDCKLIWGKTSKGKLISKFECIMICWSYLNYFSPKTRWENMRRNYILNIFLKTLIEKTEDIIYPICLEYLFKNSCGEN